MDKYPANKDEEGLRELLQYSKLGYVKVDIWGRMLAFNEQFKSITGYSEEELGQMDIRDIDCKEDSYKLEKIWHNIKMGTPEFSFEKRIRAKSGEIKSLWVSGTAIRKSEEKIIDYFVGVCEDITEQRIIGELKRSEEKYRILFEENPVPLWIFDLKTKKFLDVNKASIFKYGFSKEEFLATSVIELTPAYLQGFIVENLEKLYNNKVYQVMTKHWLRSGVIIDVVMIVSRVIFEGRDAVFVTINDITAHKKEEQEVIASVLEATDKERERIAKDLHDGLTQSLTAVSFMLNSVVHDNYQKLSAQARDRMQYCIKLLNNAIEESRNIAYTIMPRSVEEFGLFYALKDLLENLQTSYPDIEFQSDLQFTDEKIQKNVAVNIFRIIQEAVHNATNHADPDRILIRVMALDQGLEVIIRDNGKGFKMGEGDPGQKGLGLRTMKNRALNINAMLSIDSNIGEGTDVHFYVPNA